MDRRTFLVALTPFVAGCFGGQRSQPAAEPTASDEGGSTATDAPERGASTAATDGIRTARDRLTEAVYVYTGGVSDDLLSVTAAAESFRAREVLLRLNGVQGTLAEAEDEATTDEQRTTVRSLDALQRFLTQATDAQSWLIDGHDALTAAYTHMDDGDLDAAADDVERVETAAEEVADPAATVEEESDAASAAALDAIDEAEYDDKVSQLVDESEALTSLAAATTDIREGIELIERATAEVDDGRTGRAADTADRAYEVLTDAEDRLDDLIDDFPERAEAFETLADDMRFLASRRADEADALYEEHS